MRKVVGLSILSVIISVTALCVVCVRNNALDFDWYGALIGVLSLLVTVLIGWNIYSYLKIERDIIQSVDNQLAEYNERVDKRFRAYELDVSDMENRVISLTFYTIGENMSIRKEYLLAIDYLTRSLISLNQIKNPPEYELDKTLSSIERILPIVEQTKIDIKNIGWTSDYADYYISEVLKVDNERTKPLLDFIYIVRVMIIGKA